MIIFTILALIVILLIIFAVAVLSVSGAAFIIVFGDVIVCIAIIWFVARLLSRKKRRIKR